MSLTELSGRGARRAVGRSGLRARPARYAYRPQAGSSAWAVLGASSNTYAEATASQRLAEWIGANIHGLEFVEGAPHALVPDQLKSAADSASCSIGRDHIGL